MDGYKPKYLVFLGHRKCFNDFKKLLGYENILSRNILKEAQLCTDSGAKCELVGRFVGGTVKTKVRMIYLANMLARALTVTACKFWRLLSAAEKSKSSTANRIALVATDTAPTQSK